MFDIGFWEIAVIGAIMLVVLGPERLPGVARTAGFWLSKMRRMVNDVKSEVKKEMDAAELKELDDAKNQIHEASKNVQSSLKKSVNTDDLLGDSKKSDTPDQQEATNSQSDPHTSSEPEKSSESGKS